MIVAIVAAALLAAGCGSANPPLPAPTTSPTVPDVLVKYQAIAELFKQEWGAWLDQAKVTGGDLQVYVKPRTGADALMDCVLVLPRFNPDGMEARYCKGEAGANRLPLSYILLPQSTTIARIQELLQNNETVGDVYLKVVAMLAYFYADHLVSELTRLGKLTVQAPLALVNCLAGMTFMTGPVRDGLKTGPLEAQFNKNLLGWVARFRPGLAYDDNTRHQFQNGTKATGLDGCLGVKE
jgi:hypothetical protein